MLGLIVLDEVSVEVMHSLPLLLPFSLPRSSLLSPSFSLASFAPLYLPSFFVS